MASLRVWCDGGTKNWLYFSTRKAIDSKFVKKARIEYHCPLTLFNDLID